MECVCECSRKVKDTTQEQQQQQEAVDIHPMIARDTTSTYDGPLALSSFLSLTLTLALTLQLVSQMHTRMD